MEKADFPTLFSKKVINKSALHAVNSVIYRASDGFFREDRPGQETVLFPAAEVINIGPLFVSFLAKKYLLLYL